MDPCHEQQVQIATLWSFVLFSELTLLPSGIVMDYLDPAVLTLLMCCIYAGSSLAVWYMPEDSPLLAIPFFCLGMVAQAISLLAMRTVFIFETVLARKRWILLVCMLFDTSAIVTMIFYELWERHIIVVKDVFLIVAVLGGILLGTQSLLWVGLRRSPSSSKDVVKSIDSQLLGDEDINNQDDGLSVQSPSLHDIFCTYKFYFFISLCAMNVYRIRYFLGLAVYTLIDLNDNGTYLHMLGYCFSLSVVFSPPAEKILRCIKSWKMQFHLVNGVITAYFVTWLIPNLPIQIVTFALFVLARLFCFTVLAGFCAEEFSEKRVGLVLGFGLSLAAIPGLFTYKIVDVALVKYDGNFWPFHMMCIGMSVLLFVVICTMRK